MRPKGKDHLTDIKGSKVFTVTIKSKFTTKSAQHCRKDTQNTARIVKMTKKNPKTSVS